MQPALQVDKVASVYLQLFFFFLLFLSLYLQNVLHPCLFFLNSLVVNYQISHNSLEPLCSNSPTATHTHRSRRFRPDRPREMWTHTSHTNWFLSLLWLYPPNEAETRGKMQSVNCWCMHDLLQSLSVSKVHELHSNSLIPPNITHHAFIWNQWMTLSSIGQNWGAHLLSVFVQLVMGVVSHGRQELQEAVERVTVACWEQVDQQLRDVLLLFGVQHCQMKRKVLWCKSDL